MTSRGRERFDEHRRNDRPGRWQDAAGGGEQVLDVALLAGVRGARQQQVVDAGRLVDDGADQPLGLTGVERLAKMAVGLFDVAAQAR